MDRVTTMQGPQIDYAPPLPLHQRRRVRRPIIFIAITLFVALVGWIAGPPAYKHAQLLYCQRQVMTYSPPTNQVVCTDDPIEASTLLTKPEYYYYVDQQMGGAFFHAKPWQRFYQLLSPPGRLPAATLFLHERRNSKGNRRIVVVEEEPTVGWAHDCFAVPAIRARHDPFGIRYVVFEPGSPRADPAEVRSGTPIHIQPVHSGGVFNFKWYAGQADPADPTHFTIKGEINLAPVLVDGWLNDDDTVALQITR